MPKLFATILEGSNKCALCCSTIEARLSPTSCQKIFAQIHASVGHIGMARGEKSPCLVTSSLSGTLFSRIHDKRPMGRPAESHLSLSHMDMKIGTLPDQLMFTTHTDSCSLHFLWIPAATLLPRYSTCRYVFLDFQMKRRWRQPFLKVPVAPFIYDMSTALDGVPKHSEHHVSISSVHA